LAVFGHHEGHQLVSRDLSELRRDVVMPFLREHADAPATVAALAACERIAIIPGKDAEFVPWGGGKKLRKNPERLLHRELVRLQHPPGKVRRNPGHDTVKQVGPLTALEVLAEILCVWVNVWSGGGRNLPDDGKSLTYAIGHRIFALRPASIRYSVWIEGKGQVISRRMPGGQAARLLGERLREALKPYLGQAYPLLEERRMAAALQQNHMRTPLRPPKPVTAEPEPTPSPVIAPRPLAPSPAGPPAVRPMTAEERRLAYLRDREEEARRSSQSS